jgi:hypothetical protein
MNPTLARRPAWPCLALLLLTAGCVDTANNWVRVPIPAPDTLLAALREDHWVQVWAPRASRSHVDWFAVVISRDSVSGLPSRFHKRFAHDPSSCENCRRSLPLTDVDSIRLGSTNSLFTVLLGAAVTAGALAILALTKSS